MNHVLTISINSFSYKRGIPEDTTGNGGGFVFDCRAINNPGRQEKYKSFTGRDEEINEFFDNEPEMHEFLRYSFSLIDQVVIKYLDRDFTHLMVNFGCTGGQHRSVYCAEKLAKHLSKKFDVDIDLTHIELEKMKEEAE